MTAGISNRLNELNDEAGDAGHLLFFSHCNYSGKGAIHCQTTLALRRTFKCPNAEIAYQPFISISEKG
jgi:hypothetical protein